MLLVGGQNHGEVVLGCELVVALHRIGRDANDGRAELCEVLVKPEKSTASVVQPLVSSFG